MGEQDDCSDAIVSNVEIQEWQLNEIGNGLREADAGDFTSDEEVADVFAKWKHTSS